MAPFCHAKRAALTSCSTSCLMSAHGPRAVLLAFDGGQGLSQVSAAIKNLRDLLSSHMKTRTHMTSCSGTLGTCTACLTRMGPAIGCL